MSVVKRTSLGVDAKHKTKHSKVLRTRATGKEVDHSALIKRAIKLYPKTSAPCKMNQPGWGSLSS